MEFIKNNQCLKIRVAYDSDMSAVSFEDFIEETGLERLSAHEWLKIGNPEAMHFAPDDLKHDDWVFDCLKEVAPNIGDYAMPALTDEEFEELFYHVGWEEWQEIDLEVARRGLLSMTHVEWYESLSKYDDLRDILAPYTYSASGYSQGDYARLYLIGMEEEEAEYIRKQFELYCFEPAYCFHIELIDCESGEETAWDSLGGIYDTSSGFKDLKGYIVESLQSMDGLHPDLLTEALEAVNELDYTDIKY